MDMQIIWTVILLVSSNDKSRPKFLSWYIIVSGRLVAILILQYLISAVQLLDYNQLAFLQREQFKEFFSNKNLLTLVAKDKCMCKAKRLLIIFVICVGGIVVWFSSSVPLTIGSVLNRSQYWYQSVSVILALLIPNRSYLLP